MAAHHFVYVWVSQCKADWSGVINTIHRVRIEKQECLRAEFQGRYPLPRWTVIDMGNPFLNLAVDGFFKIGTVAATRAAAEETFHILQKGNISKHDFENSLKIMCKEGAYWGAVAGLYVGTEYGVERIRGTRDWKNAMIGGAVTGAVVSAASSNKSDRIVIDAITGAAISTAAEFINYLT